eukprot:TRINITY_DN14313_c0_g1_i3.p3 TRINITY_DN14313_c0_g1~~TRINITY_DN14313_c0_g1_i3.p3  ORF type:complete len:212 (-),score=-10.79 TRINITY_DN14313_c0_g1_i3:409-1044(-)
MMIALLTDINKTCNFSNLRIPLFGKSEVQLMVVPHNKNHMWHFLAKSLKHPRFFENRFFVMILYHLYCFTHQLNIVPIFYKNLKITCVKKLPGTKYVMRNAGNFQQYLLKNCERFRDCQKIRTTLIIHSNLIKNVKFRVKSLDSCEIIDKITQFFIQNDLIAEKIIQKTMLSAFSSNLQKITYLQGQMPNEIKFYQKASISQHLFLNERQL